MKISEYYRCYIVLALSPDTLMADIAEARPAIADSSIYKTDIDPLPVADFCQTQGISEISVRERA